jgi:L-lactate dehydrogenase complex protein LldG
MSATGESRTLILDRIRAATARVRNNPIPESPRTYIRRGSLDSTALIELMVERLREYDADVVECGERNIEACISECLIKSGKKVFAAPPGLPSEWISMKFEWKIDRKLSNDEIEKCDGVVTTASAGIADSGTIVLHHSTSEGRRVLTLLPDWHLCILRVNQIVETLPEYFERCEKPPGLATFISGPSATADIEMTRIKGVHGPRFLNVILVHDKKPGEPEPPEREPEPEPEAKPETKPETRPAPQPELPPRPHRNWRPFDR